MKSAMLSLSILASVTTLAGAATAAERIHQTAVMPSAAMVQMATNLVGTRSTDLTIYPTASRQTVFVSFRTEESDHVGLIEARHGHVGRFTDFSGPQPRKIDRLTAEGTGDAQAQARALLLAATTPVTPAVRMTVVNSKQVPVSAQAQAADLLRAAPAAGQPVEPTRLVARSTSVVRSDSQAMARAVLTASVGE